MSNKSSNAETSDEKPVGKVEAVEKVESKKPTCGIIMPISGLDDLVYSAEHWAEVRDILLEIIGQSGFEGGLVSSSDETRVIHETIVQNVYFNEMVVCDVSSKNPNVMFELGLRIAFDKPVVIIKDNPTGYAFDTSPIEHLEYPIDLNYKKINKFKTDLKAKINATYENSKAGSPYLKSFGRLVAAHIETKEVSSDEFVLRAIKDLTNQVRLLSDASRDTLSIADEYNRVKRTTSLGRGRVSYVKFFLDLMDSPGENENQKNLFLEVLENVGLFAKQDYETVSEGRYVVGVSFEDHIPLKTFSRLVGAVQSYGFEGISWKVMRWA